MSSFTPFSDDSAVLSVGSLAIENGTEVIAVHGDTEIGRDKAGLATARRLRDAFAAMVETLEAAGDLPDVVSRPERDGTTFDNPFGNEA